MSTRYHNAGFRWTKEEEEFIMDNYKSMTDNELSARLGRSPKAVWNMRHMIGAFRPKSYDRNITRRRRMGIIDQPGDFQIPKHFGMLSEGDMIILDAIIDAAQPLTPYPLTRNLVLSESRRRILVVVRQLLFFAVKKNMGWSWTDMGKRYGFDHSTIIHGYNTTRDAIAAGDKLVCSILNRMDKHRTVLAD